MEAELLAVLQDTSLRLRLASSAGITLSLSVIGPRLERAGSHQLASMLLTARTESLLSQNSTSPTQPVAMTQILPLAAVKKQAAQTPVVGRPGRGAGKIGAQSQDQSSPTLSTPSRREQLNGEVESLIESRDNLLSEVERLRADVLVWQNLRDSHQTTTNTASAPRERSYLGFTQSQSNTQESQEYNAGSTYW